MKKFREKASANYQLKLRPNRDVENAYRAYETSWETERLDSELSRQIYCELIDLGRKENTEKIEGNATKPVVVDKSTVGDDSDGEEAQVMVVGDKPKWWTKNSIETKQPRKLGEIANESYAKSFKRGSIDDRVQCEDLIDFGLNADINLPILDLLALENETFWKRLVQENVKNVLKFQKLSRDTTTNWKKIGLELRLAEFIENLDENEFDSLQSAAVLNELVEKLQSVVENLSIEKMKLKVAFEKNPYDAGTRVVNFYSNGCTHGSLEFLGGLTNLKTLSIKFDPGRIGLKYEKRFFQVATCDIEHLGQALVKLNSLQNLSIRQSDLSEPEKIFFLTNALKTSTSLHSIDLSYCRIGSKVSGEQFLQFFRRNRSLKSLELKGNNLNEDFCFQLSVGLKAFKSKFEFLGLSMNPIWGIGLEHILKALKISKNVLRLDISNCQLIDGHNCCSKHSDLCFNELIQLISKELLLELNLRLNDISSECLREKFIKALEKNYAIDESFCDCCGFSSEEMVKIKVLLLRNKFYKSNPILKKENFTPEDELEIEKFLTRTKHPILLKHKKLFVPDDPIDPSLIVTGNEPKKPEKFINFAS